MSSNQSFKPYAEVTASSLATYTAQCWEWDKGPSFGSLVTITTPDQIIWGIVSNITTGSSDAQRQPYAYQKTEEELRRDHPQIFEFLITTFDVCVVGVQKQARILYSLPEKPAKIHQFVAPATMEQRTRFFSAPSFLPLIFSVPPTGPHVDELLLAVCQEVANSGILTPALFEQYYHTFSLLVGNDYRRLKLLLSRIGSEHARLLTSLPGDD